MKIISVIPLKKGILKGDLTYFTGMNVAVGDVVSVPIRKKETLALVTSFEDLKEMKSNIKNANFNLKKMIENKGNSIFTKEFLESVFETAKYFAQNKNNVIASLIPNIFVQEYEKILKIKIKRESIKNVDSINNKNIRAEKLLFQYPFDDRISVYKTLVRESFARGKSVFMILPTEFDIEKFSGQLRKGIEQFTFALHSGISAKKNLITYEKITTSPHPVLILGTAPFLSIPRTDVGTIILEHENSGAYKMISRPYLDLRVFAEIYASRMNAKFIMADEMLRYETIGRIDTDNLNSLHPLSYRLDFDGTIEILGKEPKEKGAKFQIFNSESIEEIKLAIENRKNVFIFSLRKGLATMTVCKDCGETVECEKCGAPLVLYMSQQGKKRMFVCNRCESDAGSDRTCEVCGSWNLISLGIGTDTVYEELKKLFPREKVFKLDKESARTAAGAKKIMKEFEGNNGPILVGTEMAFFYFKNKVQLSVVASFDSLWSIPNFKMSEKIIQIVLSTLDITQEKVIIQTKNEKDKAIEAIKSGNLLSFVREGLEDRRKLGYPPFKRFIKITYLGDKTETQKARTILKETLKEYTPLIFSGFIARLKGKFITNALIKIDSKKWSLPDISAGSSVDENLLRKLSGLEPNFEVFVDPEDML